MRNYNHIDQYLNELQKDIYPQPVDQQHTAWAHWVIRRFVKMFPNCQNVLDVGCGEAFTQPYFEEFGIEYTGITLGRQDVMKAIVQNRNVFLEDFSFITFPENTFDLVFARHALEHSPFPLITLMDWHRVAKRYLCLIVPNPDYWTYVGRNHYSVMNKQQMRWLLRRTGWKIAWKHYNKYEFRYICKKHPRISYEGWTKAPLDNKIYEDERDSP